MYFQTKGGIFIAQRNTTILNRPDIVLIKNSESTKDKTLYGNLLEIIQKFEILHSDEIDAAGFDEDAKVVLRNGVSKLREAIGDEWYAANISDPAGEKVRCQLCNTPNYEVYYIVNRLNHKTLHVGSSCIEKFPRIEGVLDQQERYFRSTKEKAVFRRKMRFSKEIDADYLLDNLQKEFDKLPILIPLELYENLNKIRTEMRILKNNFINDGKGKFEKVVDEFLRLHTLYINSWKQATTYYEENKKHPFICQKRESDWLKENAYETWCAIAKNGGFYETETLKRLCLPEYIIEKHSNFEPFLSEKNLRFIGINHSIIRLQLIDNNFTVPVAWFMENIGVACIFGYASWTKIELQNVNIEISDENYDSIDNRLSSILRNLGYRLFLTYENKEFHIQRLKDKMILKIDEEFFYNTHVAPRLFSSDISLRKYFLKIVNFLNNSKNWLDYDTATQYDELAQIMSKNPSK